MKVRFPMKVRFQKVRFLLKEVTLFSKGQIVLPRNLREALGLNQGDRVNIALEDDHITIRPIRTSSPHDWRQWRGCLAGTTALQDHSAEHADEVQGERLP